MQRLALFAVLICFCCLSAQVGNRQLMMGFPTATAGTQSVTINLGITDVNATITSDTGNANVTFFTAFLTPPAFSAPSVASCTTYWLHTSSSAWGCALYSDQTLASGTATVSGSSVTWASGTAFNTNWGAFTNFIINGVNCQMVSIQSSTALTLNQQCPAQNGTYNYSVHAPKSKLCSAAASSVGSTGYNTLSLSSCGTLAANTQYWVGSVTLDNTQLLGLNTISYPCYNPYSMMSWVYVFSPAFANNASWPANLPTSYNTTGPNFFNVASDGCVTNFVTVSYSATSPYGIVSTMASECDCGPNASQSLTIPATGSNQTLVVFEVMYHANDGTALLTPSDSASDTFTKAGTCSVIAGATNNLYICPYYVTRVSSGVTSVTCNISGTSKYTCWAAVITGTLASSSFDQVGLDASVVSVNGTTGSFTGAATPTLGQAKEFALGFVAGLPLGNCCTGGFNTDFSFETGGNWVLLGNGPGLANGNSPLAHAMFWEVTSSTAGPSLSGIFNNATNGQVGTSVVTFR